MDDELELKKETLEISGGRKLYNYTFGLNGEVLEPPKLEEREAEPKEEE